MTNKSEEAPSPLDRVAYANWLEQIKKETKEICPNCKKIIDMIFEYRLKNLCKLDQELFGIIQAQPPTTVLSVTKKKRKNGKK